MEDTDQNSGDAIVRSEDEQRRLLEDMERRIRIAQRIFRDFKLIGFQVSGNVDEGFQVE